MSTYAIEIDGERQGPHGHQMDALHDAFHAVEMGAKRVVLIRDADGVHPTPLCVLSPPMEAP